jgi:RimJ/RimL family protein N-acetyltransferase
MENVSIVPLSSDHLAQVETWAHRDAATRTLLKIPRAPDNADPDSYGWAAVHDQHVLAIATVQLNKEHVGYLNCIVKPTEGRQGIGTQIIDYVLKQPAIDDLIHLHALVNQDNTPAQKVLEAKGFTRIGYGSDNQIEFARHKY